MEIGGKRALPRSRLTFLKQKDKEGIKIGSSRQIRALSAGIGFSEIDYVVGTAKRDHKR